MNTYPVGPFTTNRDALQCQPADLLAVRNETLTPNGTSPRKEPDFVRKQHGIGFEDVPARM